MGKLAPSTALTQSPVFGRSPRSFERDRAVGGSLRLVTGTGGHYGALESAEEILRPRCMVSVDRQLTSMFHRSSSLQLGRLCGSLHVTGTIWKRVQVRVAGMESCPRSIAGATLQSFPKVEAA